jgi:hypothetical protein
MEDGLTEFQKEMQVKALFVTDLFKTKKVTKVEFLGNTNNESWRSVKFSFDDYSSISFDLKDPVVSPGMQLTYKSSFNHLQHQLQFLTTIGGPT